MSHSCWQRGEDVTGLPTDGSTVYVKLWYVIAGNTQFQTYTYTAKLPPVLLVDDDNNGGSSRSFYTNALDALGVEFSLHIHQNHSTQPDAATLSAYETVIWLTGDSFTLVGPNATNEAALATFLDGGGCLFMSAPFYPVARGITSFISSYLGAASAASESPAATITGAGIFSTLGPYMRQHNSQSGSIGATVTPDATASIAFVGSEGDIGIYKDAGAYRTTLWTFPFDNIPDPVERAHVMQIVLEYCGTLPATDADNDGVPDSTDNCVDDANAAQTDTDGDNQGDVCDPDDDNDFMSDADEITHGLAPLDPSDADTDLDVDTFSNLHEIQAGSSPSDPLSSPPDEALRFERLWPTLSAPWYFGEPETIAVDSNGFVFVVDTVNNRIQKFNADGYLVNEWGRFGTQPGEIRLDAPMEVAANGQLIAVDAQDSLYLTDTLNHRIEVFSANGEFLRTWGSEGSANGELDHPSGIAIAADGSVYVADTYNDRIQVFTPEGEYLRGWGSFGSGPGQFSWPRGVVVDPAGNVYVSDYNNDRIQKFTTEGDFQASWGGSGSGDGELSSPEDLALDPDGNLLVVDAGNIRVQRFSPDGQFLEKLDDFGTGPGQYYAPIALAVATDGTYYVGESGVHRVQRFSATGEFITQWGSRSNAAGGFTFPSGVAVASDGTVVVADTGTLLFNQLGFENNRVQSFDSDGRYLSSWGAHGSEDGEFNSPRGIALDSADNVYVADHSNNRVQKFNSSGQFVTKMGTGGPGALFLPTDVAVDGNDRVYVVESNSTGPTIFGADASFLLSWTLKDSEGVFFRPSAVAVGPSDLIYLLGSEIRVYTAPGHLVTSWDGVGAAIAIDSRGFVYLLDRSSGDLRKYTADGQLVRHFVAGGTGPGLFRRPQALAVTPDDRLVIADSGNDRVQLIEVVETSPTVKAIVVAGGGPYAGNNLWGATQAMANFAYRTLTFQGFTKESIYYLSANTALDLDSNGLADDVDADATVANLDSAITEWALADADGDGNPDATEVLIYLTDHGGDEVYRISGSETVDATALDAWLDELQSELSGKVTVIYDACEAGSFVPVFVPPAAKERLVITSSSAGQLAHFTGQGSLSFSSFFWTQVFNGESVGEAFAFAAQAMGFTPSPQAPLVDVDGDGIGNGPGEGDTNLNGLVDALEGVFIGSATDFFLDAPEVGSVSSPQTISGTSTATITANAVSDVDGISSVWAILRPPDFERGSTDNPVTEMPRLDLFETVPGSGDYEGEYDGFTTPGIYNLAIYASDRLGNVSVPKLTTVDVGSPLTRRAVLIAGGPSSDARWTAFEKAVGAAYQALRFQGYEDTEIETFSATTVLGVEQAPDEGFIGAALSPGVHADSQSVVVYLVGHIDGAGLRLNATETLSAPELDALLDALQAVLPGRLTVIVEGDGSGDYVSQLTPPAGGEEGRIRISSTTGAGVAYLPSGGDASYSRFFWNQVSNGARMREAHIQARNAMRISSNNRQVARLDADGDGKSNKFDLSLVKHYSLGPGILLAGDAPVVGVAGADETTLSGAAQGTTVFADSVTTTGTLLRVFAVVGPPVGVAGVTELPEVELLDGDGDGRYEGVYGGFGPEAGVYHVTVYAQDTEGVLSLPVEVLVTQTEGLDVSEDGFEVDDTPGEAKVVVVNATESQLHTLHDAADEDWVVFYGLSGESYEVRAESVGLNVDVILSVFEADGATPLVDGGGDPIEADDGFEGEDEVLVFVASEDGLYRIRVSQFEPTGAVDGNDYRLRVVRNVAPVGAGRIEGTVIDAVTALPVVATMVTDTGDTGFVIAQEYELQVTQSGLRTLTTTALPPGYEVDVRQVTVPALGSAVEYVALVPEDVDNDGVLNGLDLDDDGDGIPDDAELANGLSPIHAADALEDADGDGRTNLDEYLACGDIYCGSEEGSQPKGKSVLPSVYELLL